MTSKTIFVNLSKLSINVNKTHCVPSTGEQEKSAFRDSTISKEGNPDISSAESLSAHVIENRGGRVRKMSKYSCFVLLFIAVLAAIVVPCSLVLIGDNDSSSSRLSYSDSSNPIRVGAFNIRRFGKTLMGKQEVVSDLVKILQRYDVVLVQEVRDSTYASLEKLKKNLIATTEEEWQFLSSPPLGRSKYYKEQYVYFYKPDSIRIISSYQVDDSAEDIYEREPFAVLIEYASKSSLNLKQRVVLLALHSKPDSVEEELNELSKTVKFVMSKFPDSLGVIILGDLNADCNYLSKSKRKSLEIFTSSNYASLIPDTADTTVSRNTDCAYDRVFVYENRHSNASGSIDVREAGVFNYETLLNIGTEGRANDISDHYPVEFSLY